MRVLIFALAALPTAAFAQISAYVPPDRPAIVTVTFASQGSASFHLADDVVTRLSLRVRGVDYSLSLECAAGGLRDVRFQSVERLPRACRGTCERVLPAVRHGTRGGAHVRTIAARAARLPRRSRYDDAGDARDWRDVVGG